MEGNYSTSMKTIKGLLQLCGQFDQYTDPETNNNIIQHINCYKNLTILNNVMECEYNQSYELFLKQFQETSVSIVKLINLEQHILSEKPCKQPALKIIAKYIEGLKRFYSDKDVRFLLEKKRIIPFKAKTIHEIESFMSDKKLTIKKVQSSSQLRIHDRDTYSGNRFSKSNHLSFSYLDAEIEEKNYFLPKRKFSNMKDAIDDQYISWKTVYNIQEKKIILQHAIPQQDYIKMSVVLPLSTQQCLDLIITQRNQWDTLLLECYTLQNPDSMLKSTSIKKEKYHQHSVHDYICETYRWNSSQRISFYTERKIEFENKSKRIFITRTAYEPQDSVSGTSDRNINHPIGKWECLVQIKQMDDDNMTSSQQSQQSQPHVSPYAKDKFRVFNFNSNNQIPKLGRFYSGKETGQTSDQLSKSGHSNSSDDLYRLADISNSGIKYKEQIQEEEDDCLHDNSSSDEKSDIEFFETTEIVKEQKDEQKNKIHSGLLSLEESKASQETRQNQQNDGQETLPNTLHHQNNSYLEQSNYSQRKKSNSKQSKKEIQERDSENDDSEENNIFQKKINRQQSYQDQLDKSSNPEESKAQNQMNNQKSFYSPFDGQMSLSCQLIREQQEEKKQKQELNSLSDASGCSINFINSAKSQNLKKQSDEIPPNDLEDSILIDPESQQIITTSKAPQPTYSSELAQTQVTFFFSLLNSEAVHFFSKFIISGDDDTMVQSLQKLQDLAKKVRKESSSTSDTKDGLRKESSDSNSSENNDFNFDLGEEVAKQSVQQPTALPTDNQNN